MLILIGNPPYSAHSSNKANFVLNLVEHYKFMEGERLQEKNIKSIQDDYIKFIRFAEYQANKVDKAIVAYISNNGFIDNPTCRGMRWSLMQTFNKIYILDLNGNSRKQDKCPDGSPDENVFEIQQGVCISFFIKGPGLENGIYYSSLQGNKDYKFHTLRNSSFR